ncbi:MAG: glycosyltransferase [Thermoplasmatota archaeon]
MAGKRVYIAACGIGLGHIGRMAAVADRLSKMGVECVFSTYGPAHRYALWAGYRALESPALMWAENEDGSISMRGSLARLGEHIRVFRAHMHQERERIASLEPSAILSDSRYSPLFIKDDFEAPFFFVSNQIRFLMPRWREGGWARLASDLISAANYHWLRDIEAIFIPDLPPPDTISRENLDVPPHVLRRLTFVGPISRRAPEELPPASEIRRRLGFGEDLFVYAAVSGPGRSREPLIQTLTRVLPEFRRKSVIDRGEPGSELNEWVGEHLNIRGWARDRFELLKACDVVVSRPGLTTISEIVRFGKPCVLIPTPTQSEQEGNARSMRDHGVARVIEQHELSVETMRAALRDIVERSGEYAERARRLQRAAAEMDGAGAVARAILERAL